MDEEIRRAVSGGVDETGLETLASERGFRSYRYDGTRKNYLLGVTTVEEVFRAV